MAATEDRAVLVMDIGADRGELLLPWMDEDRRFVIRLKGDRHLLLGNGVRIETRHLAEHLLHQNPDSGLPGARSFYPIARTIRFGWWSDHYSLPIHAKKAERKSVIRHDHLDQ